MIIINLDVMMAKRKMSLGELSEKVGITLANLSVLKNNKENTINTTSVITSCIIFNCMRVNGPPKALNPILFAGTWKQYSKNAITQLITINASKPHLGNSFSVLNLRWPYHAIVMKLFETISKIMVNSPFPILFKNKNVQN
jgi:putative transcriptional regulator